MVVYFVYLQKKYKNIILYDNLYELDRTINILVFL